MNSKSLVNCFVWKQYFEKNLQQQKTTTLIGMFYHRFMYTAPSSDHSLLTLNLPFKVIWGCFLCLEWECCTFQKIDENSFLSTTTILSLMLVNYSKGNLNFAENEIESNFHRVLLWEVSFSSLMFLLHIANIQDIWGNQFSHEYCHFDIKL